MRTLLITLTASLALLAPAPAQAAHHHRHGSWVTVCPRPSTDQEPVCFRVWVGER